MSKSNKKKPSKSGINFKFAELKVETFKYDKSTKVAQNPDGKYDYHLGVTSFFKRKDNEGIIKVTYRLRLNEVVVAEIITKNYFTILNLSKHLNEIDKPINKDFEDFMEYLSFTSVCHTRGIYCDRLERDGSDLIKFAIPFVTPEINKEKTVA